MNSGASRAALLVMDVQQVIVDRLPPGVDSAAGLGQIAKAAGLARAAGLPVIYAVMGFRDGHPEVGVSNRLLAAAKVNGFLLESDPVTTVHPQVAPQPGDVVVTKRRVDSFFGTDLAVVLRAQQVDALVLTGVTTGGVVLSTFLSAVDRDFDVTVLSDGCVDRDAELHELLVTRLFPQRANTLTVAEWSGAFL